MAETTVALAPSAAPTVPPAAPVAAPTAAPADAKPTPPVAPAAPAINPLDARRNAEFAQREIALREQQRQIKEASEAAKRQLEQATAWKQDAEFAATIKRLAKENPAEAIKALGVDYATLTKAQIARDPEAPAKRSEVEAKLKEFEQRLAQEREAAQKAAEERAKQEQAAQTQRLYDQYRTKAVEHVEASKDKYEVLLDTWQDMTGAPDLGTVLLDVIEHDYQSRIAKGEKEVKPITIEEAASRANAAAEQRAEKIAAAIAKKKAKAAPPAAEAPKEEKKADSAEKPKNDAPAADAKSAPVGTTLDTPPRPVFDALQEDFQSYLMRFSEWERQYGKKAK